MVGSNICYLSDAFLDQCGQTWSGWWHVANRSHDRLQNREGIWQNPAFWNAVLQPRGFLCGLGSSHAVHLETSFLFSSCIIKYTWMRFDSVSCLAPKKNHPTKPSIAPMYTYTYVCMYSSLGCFVVLIPYCVLPFPRGLLVSPAGTKCFIVNRRNPCLVEARVILPLALGWSGFLSKHLLILFLLYQHHGVIEVIAFISSMFTWLHGDTDFSSLKHSPSEAF